MAITRRLAQPRQMVGLSDSPNLQPQAPPLRFHHSLRVKQNIFSSQFFFFSGKQSLIFYCSLIANSFVLPISRPIRQIAHGFRCLSRAPDNSKKQTPQVLRIAVSGVTELLRLLSSFNDNQTIRQFTVIYVLVSCLVDEKMQENSYFFFLFLPSSYVC